MMVWRMCLACAIAISTAAIGYSQDGDDTSSPETEYSVGNAASGEPIGTAPSGEPSTTFVYVHVDDGSTNKFVIGPNQNVGSGVYRWRGGQIQNDTLTFVDRVVITDTRSDTSGTVDGWIYKSTGNGRSWWLFFGDEKLNGRNSDRYPIYYSFKDPASGGKFKRWITPRGTQRF